MRIMLWILFSLFLIFLHAMAMSESTDNTNATDNNIVYGFSPDRSRWYNYAIDYDDTIYYYDIKSLVKGNNNVKVWVKFGEPVNDRYGQRFYKEVNALKEIDCGSRRIKSLEWNYLSMKDEYKKYTSPTKWENIEPETANDALLEEVCTQPRKGRRW